MVLVPATEEVDLSTLGSDWYGNPQSRFPKRAYYPLWGENSTITSDVPNEPLSSPEEDREALVPSPGDPVAR